MKYHRSSVIMNSSSRNILRVFSIAYSETKIMDIKIFDFSNLSLSKRICSITQKQLCRPIISFVGIALKSFALTYTQDPFTQTSSMLHRVQSLQYQLITQIIQD